MSSDLFCIPPKPGLTCRLDFFHFFLLFCVFVVQPNGLLQAQQHSQGNLNLGGAVQGSAFPNSQPGSNSNQPVIYTLNEHGQLVPLQPQGSQVCLSWIVEQFRGATFSI